ncbi:MAG TPA: hypothetical protein PKD72_00455 [Gemmatales bacterium]|nr:hypothetical protein [Gemmatales bacterium]
MVSLPFWLTQRGGKLVPIDDHTIRVVGENLPTCELSVFPMPTGVGWRVAVDLMTEDRRQTLAQTESPFENEAAAWQAGFDLYRNRLDWK